MTTSNLNLSLTISAVDQASATIQQVGNAIQQIASGNVVGGIMSIGSAIAQVAAQTVQMAGDYQESMNSVQALTGSSSAQMAQYNAQLQQLAVEAGVAPQALSQGLYGVISSGYQGADAMKLLTLATEDSKIGMTDASTTTAALTSLLNNFGIKASDAARVNGEMLATVTAGNSTFGQYATAITTAATTSHQFGVSMEEMNAAWATETANRISAAQATTDYDAALREMYGNVSTIAKSLDKSKIAFNEAAFNAADFGGKVQILNKALQQANAEHVKVTGVTMQAAQAISTIASHTKMYNSDLATFSNRASMAQKTQQAWAITSQGFNVKMSQMNAALQVLMISIGNKLLPVIGRIVGAITPVIVAFTNWVNGGGQVNGTMQQIGGILQSLFLPVWQQLATLFQSQIVPLWFQLQAAIRPMMPMLQQIAQFIGGVLYAAFVLMAANIRALIGEFSGLLTGAVLMVQGLVQSFQGGFQFIQALIQLFVDVFTGNFNNLGTDLSNAAQGIVKMFQGMWTAINGVFVSAINGLIGMLNGFLQGMVNGINKVLAAAHQSTISVGNIPMVSASSVAAGNFTGFTPTASAAQGVTPTMQAQANAGVAGIQSQIQALTSAQNSGNIIAQANATNTANTANTANNINNSTIPAAANTAAAANSSGHGKTAAQIAKAADTANAQRLKLAADQQKALTASDSPAVQALVNQSKAAQAKGDTATAAFYASQADQLGAQQKAATTKAAKAAATAAHHKAVLAAAAERKAQASKNHAEIMAAKAAAQKAKAADKAAQATLKASRHKQLIDTIVQAANQVSNPQATQATAVIAATAAGVILPDYLAGTAYTAYNAQPQTTAAPTTINVTVNSSTADPKQHGKAVADEINRHLARHLRSSGNAPRYTHGGSHH